MFHLLKYKTATPLLPLWVSTLKGPTPLTGHRCQQRPTDSGVSFCSVINWSNSYKMGIPVASTCSREETLQMCVKWQSYFIVKRKKKLILNTQVRNYGENEMWILGSSSSRAIKSAIKCLLSHHCAPRDGNFTSCHIQAWGHRHRKGTKEGLAWLYTHTVLPMCQALFWALCMESLTRTTPRCWLPAHALQSP